MLCSSMEGITCETEWVRNPRVDLPRSMPPDVLEKNGVQKFEGWPVWLSDG